MALPDQQQTPEQKPGNDAGPSDWVVIGVLGALGFEFVAFVVGGALIGSWIDRRFQTHPWGLLGTMIVMLMLAGFHTFRIARKLLFVSRED